MRAKIDMMNQKAARNIFSSIGYTRSRNMVTPNVIEYDMHSGPYLILDEADLMFSNAITAYELSRGDGILDKNDIYAVTVVAKITTDIIFSIDGWCKVFTGELAKDKARAYINNMPCFQATPRSIVKASLRLVHGDLISLH